MENTDSIKRKPLTYSSTRSILKNVSLQQREQIYWRIPSLIKTVSLFPMQLDSVKMAEAHHFEVNNREWNLGPVGEDEKSGRDVEKRTAIRFKSHGPVQKHFFIHYINEDHETAFKKLVDEYLQNGTIIDNLLVYSVPKCIKEKDSKHFILKVKELELQSNRHQEIIEIFPYLDKDVLQRIQFCVRQESMAMFNEPLVKKCPELRLQFPYYDPIELITLLQDIPNKKIHVIYFQMPIQKMEELANSWVQKQRFLGSMFQLVAEEYTYILDVFDLLKDHLTAISSNITKLGNHYHSHSVTIPICDETELVVYGGPATFKWPPFKWTLIMEVMPRGSTIPK